MIKATVIADSVSREGKRLTTFEVTFHRFILAEVNTHRMLSRNYRSSRAVPVDKLLKEVVESPAMPVFWGHNRAGMQANEELTLDKLDDVKRAWTTAAGFAVGCAERMARMGLHKQIANRVLEPFLWVHGVISATEWDNFFGLRLHKDAQPEFRALARAMYEARAASVPRILHPGEWHLPYFNWEEKGEDITEWDQAIKQSVARCARVSYKPFDADRPSTLEEDLALYDKLLGAQPLHASPAEHQATPDGSTERYLSFGDLTGGVFTQKEWCNPEGHGNFVGWRQHRKMLAGESCAPMPQD